MLKSVSAGKIVLNKYLTEFPTCKRDISNRIVCVVVTLIVTEHIFDLLPLDGAQDMRSEVVVISEISNASGVLGTGKKQAGDQICLLSK